MILWDRQLKTQPRLSTNSTWNWSLSSSKVWFQFRKWPSAVLWSHSAVKAKSCLPRCDTPELYLEAKWQQSVLLCKPSYWNKYFPFVKQKCSLKNTPVMQSMMCLIFLRCVATTRHIHCSGQESENNLQFMILTYLWSWQKVKVIKPGTMLDPEQGYNHAKVERPP